MASVADTIRLAVLHAFGWLLPAVLLAWLCAVLGARGLGPLGAARRAAAALPPAGRAALCALLALCLVRGATKSGGPPAPLRSPRPAGAVAPEDVARGWRAARDGAEGPVEMPPGAETNDLLRRRGGFDWAFRVEPAGWRFPYRGGVLRGVTVLARGEVRPDAGSRYFPVPFPEGVSLLPESCLGLLPGGGASVFRHAVTAGGSLLLDWRGALVGRDPNAATNLQMELFPDGHFAWRTDGGSRLYLPVLPFDWDGDGLENAVDPEPLVPHPADAHGANAEWYAVVCSNVFERTARPGAVPVSLPCGGEAFFRTNAAARAYYFVEAVASEGPAPIRFEADRASRLGSPVVVARAGETNLVPLLVGVGYAVSSPVPFSLSAPGAPFAEIERRGAGHCEVRLPLGFRVTTSEDGRTVAVTPVPCDPGGAFEWEPLGGRAGSARPHPADRPACSHVAHGGCVFWECGSVSCGCTGCSISGRYVFEGVSADLPTVWCGCGEDDPETPEPPALPHEDMASSPSVKATFSRSVVLFEDAYTNAPGDVVPRRSSETTLTISAYGGANGAWLLVDPGSVGDRLAWAGGHRLPTSRVRIPANSDVRYEIVYEGRASSAKAHDVEVTATLTAMNDMSPMPSVATATSVRLQMEAVSTFPSNRARHVFGPLEKSRFKVFPDSLRPNLAITGTVPYDGHLDTVKLTASAKAATFDLVAECGEGKITLPFSVIGPSAKIEGLFAEPFSSQDWEDIEEAPLSSQEGGVAGRIWVRVLPSYVSFQHIRMIEGTAPATLTWGCCTNHVQFPPDRISHGEVSGGSSSYAQSGTEISKDNLLGPDRVAFWPPSELELPCGGGGYTLDIPWKWYADKPGVTDLHDWMTVRQEMKIESDGASEVRKNGIVIRREIGGNLTWRKE